MKDELIKNSTKHPYGASTRRLDSKFGISKSSTSLILHEEGLAFKRLKPD